jgi:hypothetical protein
VLDDFDNQLQHFLKVFPTEYKKVLRATAPATAVKPNANR